MCLSVWWWYWRGLILGGVSATLCPDGLIQPACKWNVARLLSYGTSAPTFFPSSLQLWGDIYSNMIVDEGELGSFTSQCTRLLVVMFVKGSFHGRVETPQRWWHIFMPNMGLNDRNAMNLALYRSAAVRVWSLKALQSIKAHQVPSLNKTCESVRVMPPDSSSNIWKQTLVIIPLFCFQILTCTQEVDLLVWNGKPMQKLLKPAAETLSISYSPIWSKIYHQCSRVLPPSYWHVATMATWDDGVCCKWVSYLL